MHLNNFGKKFLAASGKRWQRFRFVMIVIIINRELKKRNWTPRCHDCGSLRPSLYLSAGQKVAEESGGILFWKKFVFKWKFRLRFTDLKKIVEAACGHSVNGPFKKSVGAAIVLHLKVKRTVRNVFFFLLNVETLTAIIDKWTEAFSLGIGRPFN